MRLIDADKLIIDLTYDWTGRPLHGNHKTNYANIRAQILAQPTLDAVPVVRCKDCYFVNCYDELLPRYECTRMLGSLQVKPDDYCSYGKRKEKNNELDKM